MKLCVGILFVAVLSLSKATENSEETEEEAAWREWVDEHARVGQGDASILTVPLNKEVFIENYNAVKLHNARCDAGLETYTKRLDGTATLTQEEFVQQSFGLSPDLNPTDLNITASEFNLVGSDQLYANLPPIWDIRKQGPGKLVRPKNQQSCGACWAFASVAAIENANSIATGYLYSLSEQEVIDCNAAKQGCGGGWFTAAFAYAKDHGLVPDSQYRYTAKDGFCKDSTDAKYTPTVKIDGFVNLPNDANAIKFYITQNCGCAVGVAADKWQFYHAGIFNMLEGSPQLNHGVLLCGYGPGYWLLKNSWGPGFGEDGYIRVADNGKGGIFTQHVYCPTIAKK